MKFVKKCDFLFENFRKKSKIFDSDKDPTAQKMAKKCNKNENFGG